MPSPYELKTRWLEWHERWPVPDIEALKRQIDAVKREIERRQAECVVVEPFEIQRKMADDAIAEMTEVLATLERLMPPF